MTRVIVDYITESGNKYQINHDRKIFSLYQKNRDIPDISSKVLDILVEGKRVDRPVIGKPMTLYCLNGTHYTTNVVAIQDQLPFVEQDEDD